SHGVQKKRAEGIPSAQKCFWMNLELQFQRKLQLARRSRVGRRESRAGDGRETLRNCCRSTHRSNERNDSGSVSVCGQWTRLTEVRVVAEVKRVGTELKIEPLSNLCVLHQG